MGVGDGGGGEGVAWRHKTLTNSSRRRLLLVLNGRHSLSDPRRSRCQCGKNPAREAPNLRLGPGRVCLGRSRTVAIRGHLVN